MFQIYGISTWLIFFGRLIVEDFIQQRPNISFTDLINAAAIDILNSSRFRI
jgi:hypothetical protein